MEIPVSLDLGKGSINLWDSSALRLPGEMVGNLPFRLEKRYVVGFPPMGRFKSFVFGVVVSLFALPCG